MTQRKNDEERIKKAYAPRGERSQKMFNFRMDLDNYEWLQQQPFKGRYLNDLIRADRMERN